MVINDRVKNILEWIVCIVIAFVLALLIKYFIGTPTVVQQPSMYPTLKQGSLSVYVLIAQDDLNTLGFRTGGLDGIFGNQTRIAVRNYQASRGLSVDGIIGCNTWRSLQENVVGTGRTSTTID